MITLNKKKSVDVVLILIFETSAFKELMNEAKFSFVLYVLFTFQHFFQNMSQLFIKLEITYATFYLLSLEKERY